MNSLECWGKVEECTCVQTLKHVHDCKVSCYQVSHFDHKPIPPCSFPEPADDAEAAVADGTEELTVLTLDDEVTILINTPEAGQQGSGQQGNDQQGSSQGGMSQRGRGDQSNGHQGSGQQGNGQQGNGQHGSSQGGKSQQGSGKQSSGHQGSSKQGGEHKGRGHQGRGR